MKKILAFTLAETLIVMGIIGIVSALTLPNLNSSTGEKEKVAKVKKLYQNLSDAYGRAEAVYGPIDEWFGSDAEAAATNRFADRLTEFMKTSKSCGTTGAGCLSTSNFLNHLGAAPSTNHTMAFKNKTKYTAILADGTSLAMFVNYVNNKFDNAKMYVDIDGPNKGQNRFGVDIFDFSIKDKILYPSYNPDYGMCTQTLDAVDFVEDCSTLWVIKNENLDYLKCVDDLNWETKTSCK